MQASISYSKGRQLALSLLDYQMSESRTSAFTVGLGYRKKNVNLPFGIRFGTPEGARNVSNDMTFHIDFSLRDDATSNSYLDQIASQPIGGQKVIDIAPSIDYVINSRINVKFYFDQRRVEPKISSSPPITTTKGGLTIRISLAEFAQAKAGAGVSAGATAPGPGPAPLTPTQPPNGNVPPVH
jgi:cell surface protein SprA